ncbi:Hypothetical protein NCS54_00812900 [Fusarium falciforme]|uniref:Hypothetical protein n=1 Tax=Fusarium falciforme TaxID=195108 RepID=UPI0023013831|nr:Hypothetical protein NCS54_00812900 [Fusarium falciforme]WAO90692.1 Hypothetical protein NCS54_00812900 [Fusarium falciforme]
MPKLSSVLDGIPKLSALPGDLNDTKNWGFTVYRTYYGPSNDENWDKLLTTAKREAMEEAMKWSDDESGEKLKPLFRLDARSDASLLSGVDRRGLIQMYNNGVGGPPMPTRGPRVFLYTDEEILNQVSQGTFNLKAVDAEEEPREDIPPEEGDEFFGQPRYWGCMKIETRQVLELLGGLEWSHTECVIMWTENQADLDEQVWDGWDAD